jgi:hypothetical protein
MRLKCEISCRWADSRSKSWIPKQSSTHMRSNSDRYLVLLRKQLQPFRNMTKYNSRGIQCRFNSSYSPRQQTFLAAAQLPKRQTCFKSYKQGVVEEYPVPVVEVSSSKVLGVVDLGKDADNDYQDNIHHSRDKIKVSDLLSIDRFLQLHLRLVRQVSSDVNLGNSSRDKVSSLDQPAS